MWYIELVLSLVETWGDQHYIGLTGIELLGKDGEVIAVDTSMIDAEPRDLHHLVGHEHDDRTLDKSELVSFFSQTLSFVVSDKRCKSDGYWH